uniref:Ribosomal protein S7 n=1 Tax=Desmarestia aculeata TaxID=62298 RepID=A0A8F0K090_9PHAE|nr:ribosomal protein S7 [Desmarestia aculeata]
MEQKEMLYNKKNKESFNFLGVKSDPLVKKMINLLMRDGKRSKAENVLDKAFQALDHKYPGRALHIFYLGIFEAKRDVGIRLKPKPKSRSQTNPYNVYIPYTISPLCGLNLGMRAILKASRERPLSSPFWDNLSQEFVQASQGKGDVISKKYILNRLAGSNKRRAHLSIRRWSPFIS